MPVRAGEHSGWLGAGSLGSVAPGILMMKVINRNFLTLFLQNPRLSVSTYVEEQGMSPIQHHCSFVEEHCHG